VEAVFGSFSKINSIELVAGMVEVMDERFGDRVGGGAGTL
jgi:hypothetical protein